MLTALRKASGPVSSWIARTGTRGNKGLMFDFVLDVPYPVGGYVLRNPGDTGLHRIYGADRVLDRNLKNLPSAPCGGEVLVSIDTNHVITVKVYDSGIEVAPGWVSPTGNPITLRINGV